MRFFIHTNIERKYATKAGCAHKIVKRKYVVKAVYRLRGEWRKINLPYLIFVCCCFLDKYKISRSIT